MRGAGSGDAASGSSMRGAAPADADHDGSVRADALTARALRVELGGREVLRGVDHVELLRPDDVALAEDGGAQRRIP